MLKGTPVGNPGIVDQHINAPKLFHHRGNALPACVFPGNVACHSDAFRTSAGYFLCPLLRSPAIEIQKGHFGSCSSETRTKGSTQTTGAPGNHDRLPCKVPDCPHPSHSVSQPPPVQHDFKNAG
jgi:hypothetical protein